jgi:hypothetical protein
MALARLLNYLKNNYHHHKDPSFPVQDATMLEWVENSRKELVESRYHCETSALVAKPDMLTLELPCSCDCGDSGGAAYVMTNVEGKEAFLHHPSSSFNQ